MSGEDGCNWADEAWLQLFLLYLWVGDYCKMPHKIPSKQQHYSGNYAALEANLLEREIGFNTEDGLCYIKYGGELIPLGGGGADLPDPTALSLWYGDPNAATKQSWAELAQEYVGSPATKKLLWTKLNDMQFAADRALHDRDGKDLKGVKDGIGIEIAGDGAINLTERSSYAAPGVPPVEGAPQFVNEETSHLVQVKFKNDQDQLITIGALVPVYAPSSDNAFKQGDLLMVDTSHGDQGPTISWIHPDSVPTENSVKPVTSGGVYSALEALDSSKDTFPVSYTTTFSAIKAKYDAGKLCYLMHDGYCYTAIAADSSKAVFACVVTDGDGVPWLKLDTISSGNVHTQNNVKLLRGDTTIDPTLLPEIEPQKITPRRRLMVDGTSIAATESGDNVILSSMSSYWHAVGGTAVSVGTSSTNVTRPTTSVASGGDAISASTSDTVHWTLASGVYQYSASFDIKVTTAGSGTAVVAINDLRSQSHQVPVDISQTGTQSVTVAGMIIVASGTASVLYACSSDVSASLTLEITEASFCKIA